MSIFSKYIEKQNKSILLIDSCNENNSIRIIFGKTIKEKIQKISKNISYMFFDKLLIQNNYLYLENTFKELKNKYDCIFIDLNFDINLEYCKNIIHISDDIIFLIEPNLIELHKGKNILEFYKYDLEIPNKKIKIIFNKINQFQISKEILKEIFSDYEILEYIKYNPEYTLYINKNTKQNIDEKFYKKIYEKIF